MPHLWPLSIGNDPYPFTLLRNHWSCYTIVISHLKPTKQFPLAAVQLQGKVSKILVRAILMLISGLESKTLIFF